jgi:hypothetical protein
MNASDPVVPVPFQSHGLISLWELMIEYDVRLLLCRLNQLERLESQLLGITQMTQDPHGGLLEGHSGDDHLTEVGRKWLWAHLGPIIEEVAPLNLVAVPLEIQNIWNHANLWPGNRIAESLKTLRWKIEQELRDKLFLHLGRQEAEMYTSHASDVVNNAFPRARYDLEEASKCVALDRSTAAVLHLMRALEIPLAAMAKAVELDLKENWNSILNDIENKVRGKDKDGNRTEYWKGRKEEQAFFSDACTHFFFIKDAWRNYASHGMKEKYTPDEAKKIYKAVTGFCDHLSSRLRSDGEEEMT